MSKRLQVLIEEVELRDFQVAAAREGIALSEWVRRALRDARGREPRGDLDRKLRVVREAARHAFPTADIDQMLAEIAQGHGGPLPE